MTAGSVRDAAPAARRLVPVVFTLRIPRRRRTGRNAHYISPATKSASITVDAGAHQTVLDANLTPGSSACSGNTCTLAVNLAPGRHTFDVRTFDKPLSGGVPQGNVLSQNLGFPFKVVAGKANAVGMVLQGVPAGISVSQVPDEDVQGDQQSGFVVYGGYAVDGSTIFPRTFNVVATDADGNYIVGAGAPRITVKTSNATIFTDGIPSAAAPNQFVITPVLTSGYFGSDVVRFTASAGGVSAVFPLRIAAQVAPRIFITQQATADHPNGRVFVFDESGNPIAALQAKFDLVNFGGPVGIAYCSGSDELWVAGEFAHSIQGVYPNGSAGYNIPAPAYQPLGAACYDYRLYVGLVNAPVVVFDILGFPSQIATSGNWHEIVSAGLPQTPWDLLVDASHLWLTDEQTDEVDEFDHNGNVQVGFTSLSGSPVGLDNVPGGYNPVVTSRTPSSVYELGGFDLPGGFPNVSEPFGIRYDDANGYVYVVNYGNSTVTRYDTGGNQVALPAGSFAGLSNPLEIAVVP
jgi:hypothetical protein